MSFVLAHFLHDAQVVNGCEEGAPGEGGDGLRRELAGREAEFVDFRRLNGWQRHMVNVRFVRFIASEADRWGRCVVRI